MSYIRQFGEKHIKKSIKEINDHTWLIGDLELRRYPSTALPNSHLAAWSDGTSSYILKKSSHIVPPITRPPESSEIKLVYEAGDASAVWSIGNSTFCKAHYITKKTTPESVTLKFIEDRNPSFDTPKVLYHAFDNDRSYLFLQRLPGLTLDTIWPKLDVYWRHHYVNSIVKVCEEMARWKGDKICGVDGQNICEYYLTHSGNYDFSSDTLRAICERIGMDCSSFSFYHPDLGPTNIIVEETPVTGKIGIIDFESAGYFPRGWIRTKFRLSSGMDLSETAVQGSSDEMTWWRAAVQRALGDKGFEDHADAWMQWSQSRHN